MLVDLRADLTAATDIVMMSSAQDSSTEVCIVGDVKKREKKMSLCVVCQMCVCVFPYAQQPPTVT